MSGPNTPRVDGSTPQSKQMSSRLMTMKFMQRSSPASRTPSQAGTPNSEPPSKRRRTEALSTASTPNASTPKVESYVSRFGVGAAFRMRPALEEIASQRATINNTSDTQWVLDISLPTPEATSEDEGEVTNEEEDVDWNDTSARQTYGSFKKRNKTIGKTTGSNESPHGKKQEREGLSDFDDDEQDCEVESGEDASSDEEEGKYAPSRAQPDKQKAAAMDYTSEHALAALDRVDLSKSSYAKAKGAYVPDGRAGSGGRFGKHGSTPTGKFRNNDKVQKKTKHKNR